MVGSIQEKEKEKTSVARKCLTDEMLIVSLDLCTCVVGARNAIHSPVDTRLSKLVRLFLDEVQGAAISHRDGAHRTCLKI